MVSFYQRDFENRGRHHIQVFNYDSLLKFSSAHDYHKPTSPKSFSTPSVAAVKSPASPKTHNIISQPLQRKQKINLLFYCRPWSRNWPPYPFIKYCHPNDNVEVSYGHDAEKIKAADIVIFHPVFGCDMIPNRAWLDGIAKLRSAHQIFTFFQWESPEYHQYGLHAYDNFFNATMTYRQDSSFFWPYGSLTLTKLTRYYDAKYKQYNPFPVPFAKLTQNSLDDFYGY